MNMERQKEQWEEEEEEEAVSQLERRRDNKSEVQPPVNGEANAVTEHVEDEEPVQKKEINYHNPAAQQNGDEVTSLHNDSVYFDRNQGNESADGVSRVKYADLQSSVLEINSKNEQLPIKSMEFDIQRVVSPETKHYEKDSRDEILPCSSPAIDLGEEKRVSLEDPGNETGVDTDPGFPEGIGLEFSEFDVEKVIEKQTSHYLYCPNCNSCITRKVILRRKKRRVRNIRHKSKPDKSETHSALDANTVNAANDQHDGILNVGSNDSITPAAADENLDRQPDIFRCLSCFSLFIPTGNGIKLFRVSRDRNENAGMQDVQNLPLSKTNWFFSLLASDNREPAIGQGARAPGYSEADGIQSPEKDTYIKSRQGGLQSPSSTKLLEKPLLGVDHETNVPTGSETVVDHNSFNLSIQAALSQIASSAGVGLANSITAKPQEIQEGTLTSSAHEQIHLNDISNGVGVKLDAAVVKNDTGNDLILLADAPPVQPRSIQRPENVDISVHTRISPQIEIHVSHNTSVEASEARQWDILKSIVYGGLLESITSLGVVSSAAAAGAATLDILIMGLANLMGGLFIIFHNLKELKNDRGIDTSVDMNEQEDRYQQQLGRRENFSLHATLVVASFLIFGLIPPVIYGFSFREGDNRDLKIVAVGGSSLACIILLAVGKAHTQKPPRSYFKIILYYVIIGITTSGLSYVVGELLKKLFQKFNLFETSTDFNVPFLETNPTKTVWSY